MAELSKDPTRGSDILTAFKRLIADVRRERIVSVVGGQLKQMEGGKSLVIHQRGSSESAKPFRVSANDDGTIRITTGTWTRNGQPALALDTDVGKTYKTYAATFLTISSDCYVYAQIYNDSVTTPLKDPSLLPDKIKINETSGVFPTSALADESFRDRYRLLAIVTVDADGKVTKIDQRHTGDIDDQCVIADGHSMFTAVTPLRSTIERNPTADKHEGELQLANVEEAEVPAVSPVAYLGTSLSIPYVSPVSTGSCSLAWMAIDGHRNRASNARPLFRSLHNEDDGAGAAAFQVEGFAVNASPRRGVNDTYTVMIREMQNSSAGDNDYGTYVRYMDAATLVADGGAYTPSNPPPDQGGITEEEADDRYWVKGEDYTENYGDSIGDGTLTGSPAAAAPVLAIDITNRMLKGTDGTTDTLDFSDIGNPVDDADATVDIPAAATDFDGSDTVSKNVIYNGMVQYGTALEELQTQLNALLAELRTRKIIDVSA